MAIKVISLPKKVICSRVEFGEKSWKIHQTTTFLGHITYSKSDMPEGGNIQNHAQIQQFNACVAYVSWFSVQLDGIHCVWMYMWACWHTHFTRFSKSDMTVGGEIQNHRKHYGFYGFECILNAFWHRPARLPFEWIFIVFALTHFTQQKEGLSVAWPPCVKWSELNWPGLNWIELDWNGLSQTELDWTVLNWTVLNWPEVNWRGLKWSELDWIAVDVFEWTELDWLGLNWNELDWTGLHWLELDWAGLDWSELGSIGLNWIRLNWAGLDGTGLNWTGEDWTGLNWNELGWTRFNWIESDWTERNWTEPNWTELDWTGLDQTGFGQGQGAMGKRQGARGRETWTNNKHVEILVSTRAIGPPLQRARSVHWGECHKKCAVGEPLLASK